MVKKFVRAKQPVSALFHPDLGTYVVPDPSLPYASDDPLVRAFPQAFESDSDRTQDPSEVVTEVPIERATRAPGERRNTRR